MRAHILIMRSYNNAYINRAGLAGLLSAQLYNCPEQHYGVVLAQFCDVIVILRSRLALTFGRCVKVAGI